MSNETIIANLRSAILSSISTDKHTWMYYAVITYIRCRVNNHRESMGETQALSYLGFRRQCNIHRVAKTLITECDIVEYPPPILIYQTIL